MSDLDGQNIRQFRARGAGITRMTGGEISSRPGAGEAGRPIRRLGAPVTQPFPVVSASHPDADEHVDDLIAAYALGALEADERLAVERHAGYCPACARQLADMRRTTTMLPFAVAPAAPSPDVKAALFARIAQSTAPVAANEAEEYQWARPVQPKTQVTLPPSGSWLDSQTFAAVPPTPEPRRSRRSFGRALGISVPVFLTFSLLALFVIPQMLPSNDGDNPEFVDLLNSTSADCTGSDTPLITSAGITACGVFQPSSTPNNGTFYVRNLVDTAANDGYALHIATEDGYNTLGNLTMENASTGLLRFDVPQGASASAAQLCVTPVGDDPDLVCKAELTPAA